MLESTNPIIIKGGLMMKKNRLLLILLLVWVLIFAIGCGSSNHDSSSNGGFGSHGVSAVSGLPNPPGGGNIPQPSGTAGNLTVLDWAGFQGAVSYTFDDSNPSQIEHYNDLQALGVHMTFYLCSALGGSGTYEATWTQAVKDGHEIGNHTVHHRAVSSTGVLSADGSSNPGFGTLPSDATPDSEITNCTTYIKGHFGQSGVWTMATPYGNNNWENYAKNYFFICRSIDDGQVKPKDTTNPMHLPCYMANNDTAAIFSNKINSARTNDAWQVFLIHTIYPTRNDWGYGVDISEIKTSINHAKSLSDVWIDSVASIGAYWVGQKLLASSTPTTSGNDTTWTWTLPTGFPSGKYLRVKVDGGTLKQGGQTLPWDPRGYYEVSLDAGALTLTQ
jgi:Predicted xylanase/chitin deacetylase